jgi:intracellular septation protein A
MTRMMIEGVWSRWGVSWLFFFACMGWDNKLVARCILAELAVDFL